MSISLLIPPVKKVVSCDRHRVCTVSLTSSLAGSHPSKASLMVRTSDNSMRLGPYYIGGVGVLNFSFLISPAVAAAEC